MDTIKRLPSSFFEKSRPNAPENSLKDVVPFDWSKEVLSGKKKVIVELPKDKVENER